MAKSSAFAADVVAWVFHGRTPNWAARSHFWISLHTGDPGQQGAAQSGMETTYEGYRRQSLARGAGGIAIDAAGEATNAAVVEFPACLRDGAAPITHYGIGVADAGEGMLIYSGPLDEPLSLSRRHAPRLPARALSVKEI